MIYLDGSRFFFDIEGCFSNLCEKAREENKDSKADEKAKELCKGFSKFFGTKPEFVRAGADYKTLLNGIFGAAAKAIVPELDISEENFAFAFGAEPVRIEKTPDMKIKAENLAAAANENGADMIYLSNPCCPTGLEIAPEEIKKLCALTEAKVVVDESFCVDESFSVLSTASETENLVVLKKIRFGGEPVFACGKIFLNSIAKFPLRNRRWEPLFLKKIPQSKPHKENLLTAATAFISESRNLR